MKKYEHNLELFEIEEEERIEIELFEKSEDESRYCLDNFYVLEKGDLYSENEDFIFIESPYKNSYDLKVMINKKAIRQIKFRDLKAEREKDKEEIKQAEEYWRNEYKMMGLEYPKGE